VRAVLLLSVVALGVAVGPWPIGAAFARVAELEAVLADWHLGCDGCPVRFGDDREGVGRVIAILQAVSWPPAPLGGGCGCGG